MQLARLVSPPWQGQRPAFHSSGPHQAKDAWPLPSGRKVFWGGTLSTIASKAVSQLLSDQRLQIASLDFYEPLRMTKSASLLYKPG